MPTPQAKFPGRHDELPAVANFLLANFNRDMALFTDYSDDFNAAYAANFADQITQVTEVVSPDTLTKGGKKVTARMADKLKRIRVLNDLTEGYAMRAGSALTVEPGDFGCQALRKKIHSRDVEGVIDALRVLLRNITTNLAALSAKGFKAAIHTELATMPDSLTADNTLQNNNLQTRNQLVNDNIALFDELYATMLDVSKTGKVIHNTLSGTPERVPDYTMATLLKRVRQERKGDGGE